MTGHIDARGHLDSELNGGVELDVKGHIEVGGG